MINIRHAASIALILSAAARAADYPAVLDWAQRADLSTPVSGVVQAVQVRPGQTVKAGELLLALDPVPFKAGVAEARAELDRQTEEAADAKRELDRAQELYARTVSSTTELDAARLRHARAQAQLAATQARLERARWQLAASELRAPFPAIVLERRAEPGMTVAVGCQPPVLLSIAHAEELIARARLTPAQAARLRPGRAAEVRVDGTVHKGTVRSLAYDASGQPAYVVEVALPRTQGLTAGLTATLRLP